MNEPLLENAPDLIRWKNENSKLKGRGKPRLCECGAVVVSTILMECPVCRGLLPKIELFTTTKKQQSTLPKQSSNNQHSNQKQNRNTQEMEEQEDGEKIQ